MLVARAQLNLIRELLARFERDDSVMRPVADHQSLYIAIIALLRSVGHVLEKVDCVEPGPRDWLRAKWPDWREEKIFKNFIEPKRNALLKEFRGGLELQSDAFGSVGVVADPSMPDCVSRVATFDVHKARDFMGRPVLPRLRDAIAFWDRCLKEAEEKSSRERRNNL
ncbi:hypothetical protein [Acidibrevibacterium fodinaquatile]|uniref:hypothetical protein n=1 Tax=Acidibrevibacterium fodinaquatile TaxID=1969806 RepID=UPI000E0D74A6|nr:hypothetical protein [Acidibrevibacterium fodinaquatile]